jgi:hypothetical protein
MLKRFVLISGLLTTALATTFAGARQVTPIGGNPADGSESNCFDFPDIDHPARLVQICSGQRTWLVDAPMDTGGGTTTKSGEIYGRGSGSVIVNCFIESAGVDGITGQWSVGERGSAVWGALNFNGNTTWTVSLPPNASLHAYCEIPQNGGLSAIKYAAE